jgi:uncharacterized membrane protein YraQ (UPF0718 family)
MDFLLIFLAGMGAIFDYIFAHTLFCLVPAFFIAGAMSALIPKNLLLPYLGKKSPKIVSYPLAIGTGLLLAVCSCTVLPLFAGIRKSGAGLGPALVFLYTAPATSIIAILYTGSLIGWDIAFARIFFSIAFAIIIGLTISRFFPDADEKEKVFFEEKQEAKNTIKRLLLLFAGLISILILGTRLEDSPVKYAIILGLIGYVIIISKFFFSKKELQEWGQETWHFTKIIVPLLLIGVFIAGMIGFLIPKELVAGFFGNNSLFAITIPVIFGVFVYFPTLVEVPMAKTFLTLGMAKGPLLAYLLADPVISLPSILVVRKIMGNKRTIAYAGLIVILSILAGWIYGNL